jgi:hypothetical protein
VQRALVQQFLAPTPVHGHPCTRTVPCNFGPALHYAKYAQFSVVRLFVCGPAAGRLPFVRYSSVCCLLLARRLLVVVCLYGCLLFVVYSCSRIFECCCFVVVVRGVAGGWRVVAYSRLPKVREKLPEAWKLMDSSNPG